jgi:hypothetical protein
VERAVVAQREVVEDACGRLRHIAAVEDLGFNDALRRARELLGHGPTAAARWEASYAGYSHSEADSDTKDLA